VLTLAVVEAEDPVVMVEVTMVQVVELALMESKMVMRLV
jgi:hypothetical protein